MSPRAAPWIPLLAAGLALSAAAPQGAEEDPPSRALLVELCRTTRLAGTRGSYVAARDTARWLEEAGWQATIEAREVLLSYPRRTELEVFEGAGGASVHLRIEAFDPDAIPDPGIPLSNAWSASGEVRGPVVDAGRGLRADFERLKAAGVELRGAIALCRYGGSYRGIKADLAAQYGCAAALLWSDPKSDGAERGATWPYGPWKPAHDAQRGSISPIGRTPGDPSTPGWPSPRPGERAERLAGPELDAALPRIPCMPIGAAEAEVLRRGLAERAFLGADGAPITEAVGPGPREARVRVDAPREVRTIWNVVGTLPGASADFVLAGAHRDAWVRGANDNASGCVVLVRAAQMLGERARAGWTPPHTLKIAFWDGEEFGLVGSTEWAEARADELAARCFAYVNADVAVSGTRFTGAGGTPGMLATLGRVLRRIGASSGEGTLWDEWCAARKDGAPDLGLPGSGSDFAVFVHHIGIPFVEVGLGGNGGGQYHTAFDDVGVVERFLDPGYVGHELCARLQAELLAELATSGPACFDGAEAAGRLAREAESLAAREAEARPALAGAAGTVATALRELERALAARPQAGRALYRALRAPDGLPGRAWFTNALWSPGLEDGYGSESFPTLRAAADDPAALAAAADALAERVRRLARSAGE